MGGDGGSIPGRADLVRVKGYGFKRNLGGLGYDANTLVGLLSQFSFVLGIKSG